LGSTEIKTIARDVALREGIQRMEKTNEYLERKARNKLKKIDQRKKMIYARTKAHKDEIENIKEKIKTVEEKEKNPAPAYFYDGTILKKRYYEDIEEQYRLLLNYCLTEMFDWYGGFDK